MEEKITYIYILIPHFNSSIFLFSIPPNVLNICKIFSKFEAFDWSNNKFKGWLETFIAVQQGI